MPTCVKRYRETKEEYERLLAEHVDKLSRLAGGHPHVPYSASFSGAVRAKDQSKIGSNVPSRLSQ